MFDGLVENIKLLLNGVEEILQSIIVDDELSVCSSADPLDHCRVPMTAIDQRI